MTFVKLTACGLLLAFGLAMSAQAVEIADFNGDFVFTDEGGKTRAETSADGWDYMWNFEGTAIGTAANYSSLVQNGVNWWSDIYCPREGFPTYWPAYVLNLGATGGSPGAGTEQGYDPEYFAIAAYTVQTGEAGTVSITDSSFGVGSADSNGVELRVYVGDTLITSFVQAGGAAASSFDVSLGSLNVGDTVYVAAGPNALNYFDWFDLSYKLTSLLPAIPGDASGDRKVDASDAAILADNWQYGVTPPTDATWAMGDFNGDYKVDDIDATILATNWQRGVLAAVPEPSVAFGLLCLGLATLAAICRRRVHGPGR